MSDKILTPDEIQATLQTIMQRRAVGRKKVHELEIIAGNAKAEAELAFALAKEELEEGTVSAREAHAMAATKEIRQTTREAQAQFNFAKGLLDDLKNDQMAWQSILKNIYEELS